MLKRKSKQKQASALRGNPSKINPIFSCIVSSFFLYRCLADSSWPPPPRLTPLSPCPYLPYYDNRKPNLIIVRKQNKKLFLKSLNHKINAFWIFCTPFQNPHFLQKCLIFSWLSIFCNRVAAESQMLWVEIWAYLTTESLDDVFKLLEFD